MANYFYVKSGLGTRTTDTSFTAAETGAFGSGNLTAANVYPNIMELFDLTTPPRGGDFIYVSSAHAAAFDNGSDGLIGALSSNNGDGLMIISVDDTDVTAYLPGASENLTDSVDDISLVHSGLIAGVSFETGDIVFKDVTYSQWVLQDMTVNVDGNTDIGIYLLRDGSYMQLHNVDFNGNATNWDVMAIAYGSRIDWFGGALTGAIPNELMYGVGSGTIGGFTLNITGVDLSLYPNQLMPNCNAGSQDVCRMTLRNCQLHAGVTLFGTLDNTKHRFEMYNCDDSTGGALHRFVIADAAGVAINNDAVYADAVDTWYEGTDKSSIQVETSDYCSPSHPFIFDLPAQYIDLGDTASDSVSVDMVTNFTLSDHEIIAVLVYPDGTTQVKPNIAISTTPVTGSNFINPMGVGTELTNVGGLAAGDWTGEPASPKFYRMTVDTSGDAGEAIGAILRIVITKSGIDPTAGALMYINPVLVTS